MTQYLPPNLLALFAPRAELPFLPPPQKLPHEKKTVGYSGVGVYLQSFEDPNETPAPVRIETREERQERKRRERAEQVAYKLEQDIALWDPYKNSASTTDPYKTLFIARINYDTSESKLRREFEGFGPVRKINLVHNNESGKPRGYAFIEYEHERDMHSAYKHADGKKIDGRRVLVDVERGRIVKGWLPRRLGGGLGGTRRGGPDVNVKHSGREDSRLDERYLERERERGGAERGGGSERGGSERGGSERGSGTGGGERVERGEKRRSRSRSREHKRRSRSRSRERHRGDRHKHRDSNRDPERVREVRERGSEKVDPSLEGVNNGMAPPPEKRERSRRSRSRERTRDRDRDRKRRRSRSRSRERKRRERGDRDRSDRGGDRDDRRGGEPPTPRVDSEDKDERMLMEIKQEPIDDGYNNNNNNSNPDYDGPDYNYDGDGNNFPFPEDEPDQPYIKYEPEDA